MSWFGVIYRLLGVIAGLLLVLYGDYFLGSPKPLHDIMKKFRHT
jgi:hypothetical protein